jgi:hypothetical protein
VPRCGEAYGERKKSRGAVLAERTILADFGKRRRD